jgi:hypothetical protein
MFEACFGRVLKRFRDDFGRCLMGVAQKSTPWSAVTVAESEVEEQFQELGVVAGDVSRSTVVDGLAVVGLGSGFQEQASGASSCWCGGAPCSPRPGTPVSAVNGDGKPPTSTRIRIGAGVKQQLRDAEWSVLGSGPRRE